MDEAAKKQAALEICIEVQAIEKGGQFRELRDFAQVPWLARILAHPRYTRLKDVDIIRGPYAAPA